MQYDDLRLNETAATIAEDIALLEETGGVVVHRIDGATVVDCGVEIAGSLEAGRLLAEICMGGLGEVTIGMDRLLGRPFPKIVVNIEEPAAACLLSQYAGWKIALGKYFAMGSGPMRAIEPREEVFQKLEYSEPVGLAVGVLETSQLPDKRVVQYICGELGIESEELILLAAKTSSLAGSLQVVARSVETCLHKLLELDFDVTTVRAAFGSALLPPIPKKDLVAVGRTNDSILYGSEVILWVDADDDDLDEVGPKAPASASSDYGRPFGEIFKAADGDFYKIDPLLFSPALVTINNLRTGSYKTFGKLDEDVLLKSFTA